MKNKIIFGLLLAFPLGVSADVIEIFNPLSADRFPNPLVCEDISCVIEKLTNFISLIAFAVAPIMILIGAFYFITAGGNPERVRTGKQVITYAIIGLVIILLARAIVATIQSIF